MRRTTENCAGAVIHKDEVGDIDGQLPVRIERVGDGQSGVEATLVGFLHLFGRGTHPAAFRIERSDLRIVFQRFGQRMICRDSSEACPEQRVRPCGINLQLIETVRAAVHIKAELQTL